MNKKNIFKLFVSLGILTVLLTSIDLVSLGKVMLNADPVFLSIALVFVLSIRFVMAYRWQVVLHLYRIFPKFLNLLSIVFISNSVGQLLPGGIGVDVVRSYQLSKEEGVATEIAASVFLDRVIGLFSMLLIAFISSVVGAALNTVAPIYAFVSAGSLTGFLVLYSLRNKLTDLGYTQIKVQGRLKVIVVALSRFIESLGAVRLPKVALFKLLLLSVSVQFIRIVIFFTIFLSLGVHAEFLLFMVFVPLLFIVMLMPVSIGGLGIREGALYLFFKESGVSLETCTAAGLSFHFLQLISLLPGVFLYLLKK
ncbi:MAG: flippase-like domain-containing protein [Nitrospirae bacterium]|nr:flippase-like domain-containing protein [Candidatus Manganitrophaceae bacterium]